MRLRKLSSLICRVAEKIAFENGTHTFLLPDNTGKRILHPPQTANEITLRIRPHHHMNLRASGILTNA